MKKVKLVEDVLKANDQIADDNRRTFSGRGITVINFVSSPGAGKTAILERTIDEIEEETKLGVIEGDVYTARDAERLDKKGVPVVLINTEGACHLDANMISQAMEELPLEELELVFIENVGNLVCPAGYDLGEDCKVTVLSLPEGEDKAGKYPAMFKNSELVLINKMDLHGALGVDLERIEKDIGEVAPQADILRVSAETGEGFDEWLRWLKERRESKKKE